MCERFTDIASKKWEIRNHRNVVGAQQDGYGIALTMRQRRALHADAVLVATGRIPNGDLLDAELAGVEVTRRQVVVDEYQRTTARGIFALGDVSSDYQLKHVANHEMRVVKHNLLQDWDDTERLMPSDHRYRAVGGVHRSADRHRRPDRKRGPRKGIQRQVQGAGLRRRRLRLGDGGHHRHREDHRRRRHRADSGRAHHGPSGVVADPAADPGDELRLRAQDMARGQYWIHPALPEVIENALLALCGEPPWPPARRH